MTNLRRSIGSFLFPQIVWHTTEPTVHLTFDDGPDPDSTPAILHALEMKNIKATFFLLGKNAQQSPELVRDIASAGHVVGNHTFSHPNLFLKQEQFQRNEIKRSNDVIEDILNRRVLAFRPPYGYFDFTTLRITRELNLRFVMWDADPKDFSSRTDRRLIRYVVRKTLPGSILLFHDNQLSAGRSRHYLEQSIAHLVDKGFQFAAIPL